MKSMVYGFIGGYDGVELEYDIVSTWEPEMPDEYGKHSAFIKTKDNRYFLVVLRKNNRIYSVIDEVSEAVALGKENY